MDRIIKLVRITAYKWMLLLMGLLVISCNENDKKSDNQPSENFKDHTIEETGLIVNQPDSIKTPEGMVWIPGGKFMQGAIKGDKMALEHEKPPHAVALDGFFMDITEVTNLQFQNFVAETGYVTVAERALDWEELKVQLPPGTPKPHDSIFKPGSLIFKTGNRATNLYDFSQWWEWRIGASWKQPYGPGSDIKGKENYPVIHIAYEDAIEYCKWAGRRLPTEAEWEYAARGGNPEALASWGENLEVISEMANTWQGEFPKTNTEEDGFVNKAPVKSFPPNPYGLYDMSGNVWEWTKDWYVADHYATKLKSEISKNPQGPNINVYPNIYQKVIKGGSFLCNASYCSSFRISARMANSVDSSQEHLGFRTVLALNMF